MAEKDNNLIDEVMCFCSGTKRSQIKQMFELGLDQEAISRRTGAVSGCAGCEWEVANFLRELAEERKG
jgi:bacterioferritin-associated ferredoxin